MKFISKLISLLFPQHCALCRKPSKSALCPECEKHLVMLNYGCCERCGKPFRDCICKKKKPKFKRCISAFNYDDAPVKALIYKLKEKGTRCVVSLLSDAIAKRMSDEYKDLTFDYITYAPSSFLKRSKKGFDHAQLIAKEVSKALDIPFTKPPIKRHSLFSQKYLSFSQRLKNAQNGYTKTKLKLSGRVLIIDDIITTGSTLSVCSSLIKSAGAKEVYAAVCASSPK